MTRMQARYTGTCNACDGHIAIGDMIIKTATHGTKYAHDACPDDTYVREPRVSTITTFRDGQAHTWTQCNCEDYPCCGH